MWLFGSSRSKQEQEYIALMKTQLLDVSTLATRQQHKDLLQFKEYVLKIKSKLAQQNEEREQTVHGLVDSVKQIIKDKTIDSGPKFFALLLLKEVMETPNPELLAYVQKKIISRLHDLADFQRAEPNLENKAPYVLHQYNPESDLVWSRRFYILNLECIHKWATSFPNTPEGEESEFTTYHQKLIRHGVSFVVKESQLNFLDEKIKKLEELSKSREGRSSANHTIETEPAEAGNTKQIPTSNVRQSAGNDQGARADSKPRSSLGTPSLDDRWQELIFLLLNHDSPNHILEHIDEAMQAVVDGLKQTESELHRTYFQRFLKLWSIQSRAFETEDDEEAIRALNTLQIAVKKLQREFEGAKKGLADSQDARQEGFKGAEPKLAKPERPREDSPEGEEEQDQSGHEEPIDGNLEQHALPEDVFQGQTDPFAGPITRPAAKVPFASDFNWNDPENEKDDSGDGKSQKSHKSKPANKVNFNDDFWNESPGSKAVVPTPSFNTNFGSKIEQVAAPVKIGSTKPTGFVFNDDSIKSDQNQGFDLDDFAEASNSQLPEKSFRTGKMSQTSQRQNSKVLAVNQPNESVTFKPKDAQNAMQPSVAKGLTSHSDANLGQAVKRSFAELWGGEDDVVDTDLISKGRVNRSMLHRLNVSKERTTRLGTSLAMGSRISAINTDIRDGVGIIKSGQTGPAAEKPLFDSRRVSIHASGGSRENSSGKRHHRESNVMLGGKPYDPHPIQEMELPPRKFEDSQVFEAPARPEPTPAPGHFDDPWAGAFEAPADPGQKENNFQDFFGRSDTDDKKEFGVDFFESNLPLKTQHTNTVQKAAIVPPAEPVTELDPPSVIKFDSQKIDSLEKTVPAPKLPEPRAEVSIRASDAPIGSEKGFDLDDFEAVSDGAIGSKQLSRLDASNQQNKFGDEIDLEGIAPTPLIEPPKVHIVATNEVSHAGLKSATPNEGVQEDFDDLMGEDDFKFEPKEALAKQSKLKPWVFNSGDAASKEVVRGQGEVHTPDQFNPFEFESEGGIDHGLPNTQTADWKKRTNTFDVEQLQVIVLKGTNRPGNLSSRSASQTAPLSFSRLTAFVHNPSQAPNAHHKVYRPVLSFSRCASWSLPPTVRPRPVVLVRSSQTAPLPIHQLEEEILLLKREIGLKESVQNSLEEQVRTHERELSEYRDKDRIQGERIHTLDREQHELQGRYQDMIEKYTEVVKKAEEAQRQERILRFELENVKRMKFEGADKGKLVRIGGEQGTSSATVAPTLERALKDRMESLLSKNVELQQRILELESDAALSQQKQQTDTSVMEQLLERCQQLTTLAQSNQETIDAQAQRISELECWEQEGQIIMSLGSMSGIEGERMRKLFWEWIKPSDSQGSRSLLNQFISQRAAESVKETSSGPLNQANESPIPKLEKPNPYDKVATVERQPKEPASSTLKAPASGLVENSESLSKPEAPLSRPLNLDSNISEREHLESEPPARLHTLAPAESSLGGVGPSSRTVDGGRVSAEYQIHVTPAEALSAVAVRPPQFQLFQLWESAETTQPAELADTLLRLVAETTGLAVPAFRQLLLDVPETPSQERCLYTCQLSQAPHFEVYLIKGALWLCNPLSNELPLRLASAKLRFANQEVEFSEARDKNLHPGDSLSLSVPVEAAFAPPLPVLLLELAAHGPLAIPVPLTLFHHANAVPMASPVPEHSFHQTLTLPSASLRLSELQSRFPVFRHSESRSSETQVLELQLEVPAEDACLLLAVTLSPQEATVRLSSAVQTRPSLSALLALLVLALTN